MSCAAPRRAQSSIEFLVLTGFMFFVFIAFFLVMQERSGLLRQQVRVNDLQATADIFTQEVSMANRVYDGYSRDFELPLYINDENYSMSLDDSSEITLRTENGDIEYLVFLPTNISLGNSNSGLIKPMTSTDVKLNIAKSGGVISVRPV